MTEPDVDANWEVAKFRLSMAGARARQEGYKNLSHALALFIENGEKLPELRDFIIEACGAEEGPCRGCRPLPPKESCE